MTWITTKLLGYVCGVLLLAVMVASVGWRTASLRADAADAKLSAVESGASACRAANAGWELTTLDLQLGLATCQQQWADAKQSGDLAVAQARTGWARAEAELNAFGDRWRKLTGHCPTALQAMQEACADQIGSY